MARSKDFFSEYPPHSRHKLMILEQYFTSWGFKLGLRDGAGDRLLYVDACAGPGKDAKDTPGSPLIAARAAAIASDRIAEMRRKPFRIDVVAIEAKSRKFKQLEQNLSSFGDAVQTLRGTLAKHIHDIEKRYDNTPALFFIDPFGLEPLQAAVVERALAGPHHEAFLLFAGQAALRHFGAVVARQSRAEAQLQREDARHNSRPLDLFAEYERQDEVTHVARRAELKVRADRGRKHLRMTQERALQILNAAYGDSEWLAEVNEGSGDRRDILVVSYCRRLRKWGAEYTLRIPILSKDSCYVYTLVHATKSPKGYSAMKVAVEYALNHSDLPQDAVEDMRAAMRVDLDSVTALIRTTFAGQKAARWSEDPRSRKALSIGRFLLERTEAWPSDKAAVRARLAEFQHADDPRLYSFPGLGDRAK